MGPSGWWLEVATPAMIQEIRTTRRELRDVGMLFCAIDH